MFPFLGVFISLLLEEVKTDCFVCHSSRKCDGKVNFERQWGRNRSSWSKPLSFLQVKSSCVATSWIAPLLSDYEYFMPLIWHRPQEDISRFFPNRNPGVKECHAVTESVRGPRAVDGVSDALVDDIRWIFSLGSRRLLCLPWLMNRWAVGVSLLLLMFSCYTGTSVSDCCVLTNCDHFQSVSEWGSLPGLTALTELSLAYLPQLLFSVLR